MSIEYRLIECDEIDVNLFSSFVRKQIVNYCWRKIDGKWMIKSDPFIDDWSEDDYNFLVKCLKNTVKYGGRVLGAFIDGKLKGFASVEGILLGTKKQYADLSCIHVSQDVRRMGIGSRLFENVIIFAKKLGAEKLYISAHSAVETQSCYKAMGRVEAAEYIKEHTQKEPFDCQLEYYLE